MIETREAIEAIFRPRAVAVFGASEDKDKFGGRLYAALLRHGFRGDVYPINPRREHLLGVNAYPSLDTVPGPVDVAAIALPTEAAVNAIEACAARGVKAAIVISTGFGETGTPEGAARQARLLELVARGGPRILGPNCLGAINTEGVALCSTIALEKVPMERGGVSLISHSGALLGSMMSIAQDQGIGFRYLVSGGNEADLGMTDFLEQFIDDPGTRVIAAFIEHIRQPQRFLEAARRARDAGKAIVVLKVGRSAASATVARSHTGALTGDDRINDAVFRACAIVRVETPEALVATAHALSVQPPARGRRLAVVSASGGACGMLADLASTAGLQLPALEGAMAAGLGRLYEQAINPLDLGGMRNPLFVPEQIRATVEALGADPAIDMLLLGLTTMPMVDRNMQEAADFSRGWEKPVLCYSITGEVARNAVATLRSAGIPVFTSAQLAVDVAAALVAVGAPVRPYRQDRPPPGVPGDAPAGADPTSESGVGVVLDAWGIPRPRERLVRDGEAAAAAAEAIGGPVAVKIATPLVPHKTEADAVRLGVVGGPAARSAFKDVNASARAWVLAQDPHAALPAGALPAVVQEMVSGIEVLVGVRVDPGFGPFVVVGMGGVLVELMDDVALRPAPFDLDTAREMIASVRGARLLDGFRGGPPADVEALTDLLVRVSWMGWALRERVREIDLNPVVVLPRGRGVRAIDVLFVPV